MEKFNFHVYATSVFSRWLSIFFLTIKNNINNINCFDGFMAEIAYMIFGIISISAVAIFAFVSLLNDHKKM